MKNLTSEDIVVQRQDGTRFTLRASKQVPIIKTVLGDVIGELNGAVILTSTTKVVDFEQLILNRADAPFIVSKEVFNALPCNAIEFITPDLGSSAIRNTFKEVHAVTQFISKSPLATVRFADPIK